MHSLDTRTIRFKSTAISLDKQKLSQDVIKKLLLAISLSCHLPNYITLELFRVA